MNLSDVNLEAIEKRPLAAALVLLHKWYELEEIKMEIRPHNCQSGLWIEIQFSYETKKYNVGVSRLDLVKERLFKLLEQITT